MSSDSPAKIGINGFGRIGRMSLRSIYETGRNDVDVVAINDPTPIRTMAHLMQYDSTKGPFAAEVRVKDDHTLTINGKEIAYSQEKDPTQIGWDAHDVDIVMECSGLFTGKDAAGKHLEGGAKKVLISAPSVDADLMVVFGVNSDLIKPEHSVVSNASCTTNCLAPVAQAIHNEIGIRHGIMTTVHAVTGDQRIIDTPHSDLNRARAGYDNMLLTSTGAAKAVGKILPELDGKLNGGSVRVPTNNVSIVDLKFNPLRATSVEEINAAVKKYAEGPLKGVMGTFGNDYMDPHATTDFNTGPYAQLSSVFALAETAMIGEDDKAIIQVISIYNNEDGFATRMSDTAAAMHQAGYDELGVS